MTEEAKTTSGKKRKVQDIYHRHVDTVATIVNKKRLHYWSIVVGDDGTPLVSFELEHLAELARAVGIHSVYKQVLTAFLRVNKWTRGAVSYKVLVSDGDTIAESDLDHTFFNWDAQNDHSPSTIESLCDDISDAMQLLPGWNRDEFFIYCTLVWLSTQPQKHTGIEWTRTHGSGGIATAEILEREVIERVRPFAESAQRTIRFFHTLSPVDYGDEDLDVIELLKRAFPYTTLNDGPAVARTDRVSEDQKLLSLDMLEALIKQPNPQIRLMDMVYMWNTFTHHIDFPVLMRRSSIPVHHLMERGIGRTQALTMFVYASPVRLFYRPDEVSEAVLARYRSYRSDDAVLYLRQTRDILNAVLPVQGAKGTECVSTIVQAYLTPKINVFVSLDKSPAFGRDPLDLAQDYNWRKSGLHEARNIYPSGRRFVGEYFVGEAIVF